MKKTDKYLSEEISKIYKNFINKFEKYLNNYTTLGQNLYINLYNFVENKISNSITTPLLNYYNSYVNKIIKEDSNNNLLIRINEKNDKIFENIENYLNKLENNMNLIEKKYYSETYLNSYENFLEYPEEIIYKIKQFIKEINDHYESIKIIIKDIFGKKMRNIVGTTNKYIKNYINNHFKFIVSNINSNNIMEKYYLSKYKEINESFSSLINSINKYSKINNNNDLKEKISLDYYNIRYDKLINDTRTFILFLEDIINSNFTTTICYNQEINKSFIDEFNEKR